MSKKIFMTSMLVALTVCSATLTTLAETTDESKVENEANVTVKEGNGGSTDPVDPIDPTDPTGQKGNLTVDGLINFKFKDVNIQAKDFKTGLKEKDVDDEAGATNARSIQVTDKRGTGAGWILRLTQSEMINTDENIPVTSNKAKLKGAYISLPLLNTKETIFTTVNNQSIAPKNLDYNFKAGGYGVAQDVVKAAKDTGLGSWVFKYNTIAGDNTTPGNLIELNIPAGNYIGTYEGVMTWTIVSPAETDEAK